MIFHTGSQARFTFNFLGSASVLGLSVGISWLSATPAALGQIDTGDHVCYFHGSDGQEHDLSALCTGFETNTAKAELEEIDTEPANANSAVDTEPTNAADALRSISTELEDALDNRLPTIEDATRLLSAPEPADRYINQLVFTTYF